MKYFLLFIIFLPKIIQAQIITNYASGRGIYDPNGIVFDSQGNLYISTALGCTIVKIDTLGVITTIAGTGSSGFSGDGGPATAAKLYQPNGIALDSIGNILFADVGNNRIRKITVVTGIITTIAGNDTAGFFGDGGLASAASLYFPSTICFDKMGNMYIADVRDYRIRKVNTSGIISTIAGNGILGDSGDGEDATSAEIYPTSICADNIGNLYLTQFAVTGSGNNVRKIDPSGIITTIAGDSASCTYNGDGIPATSANVGVLSLIVNQSNGLLFLSDDCNKRVRFIDSSGIIHTVAGIGISGDSGNGGPADSAELDNIAGITFDHCGNLYIAQIDTPCIRKVTFNSTCDPYTTKVQDVLPNETITVYPNPATSELHIDGLKSATEYRILNITGIIEQKGTLQECSNSIDTRGLASGMYLLEMTDERGYRVVRKVCLNHDL